MRIGTNFCFLIVAAIVLLACDNSADIDNAKSEVQRIRSLVHEGGFARMYEYASPRLQEVVNKEDFVDGLKKYRELFGNAENFDLSRYGVKYDPVYGKQVVLSYVPVAESDFLQESYLFAKEGEKLKLINYTYETRKPKK